METTGTTPHRGAFLALVKQFAIIESARTGGFFILFPAHLSV